MTSETRVGAYALFVQDEKILLGMRKNTGRWDGYLSPPCGRIESGESVIKGTIREILEETGAVVSREDLVLSHVRHRANGRSRLQLYFQVTGWDGEIVNAEPDLCEGWGWYPVNDLPGSCVPHTAEVIGLWRRGLRYSDEGW